MNERRLASLRRALILPPGEHVDDETLALIVTAEVAGEDVDHTHAAPLAHVERCDKCAAAYEELSQMMFAALEGMSAAAVAVPPADVYATLLAQALSRGGMNPQHAEGIAHQVAAGLPPLLSDAPRREEIGAALLQEALGRPATAALPALVQAVRDSVSALGLYLQGKAAETWGRQVSVQSAVVAGWNHLQVALLPPPQQALLGAEGESEWLLFRQRLGQPLPVIVQARAERLSGLSCRLVVHADRPGQRDAAGRLVRLTLGSRTLSAQTDAHGEARFEPLPIAALANLSIEVQEG